MTDYISYKQLPHFSGTLDECPSLVWTCNACGADAPVVPPYNSLDNGLELHGFSGSYGGFTDQLFENDIEQFYTKDKAHFCHDCCVKLFKTFPYLAKALGINSGEGHHPPLDRSGEADPCCQYSWTTKDGSTKIAEWDEDHHFLFWKDLPKE
jgi:hypothetical protein